MSSSVTWLEPLTKDWSTSILQEFFVPVDRYQPFLQVLRREFKKINVINVSVRFVRADSMTLLSYARQDSFAFVCYINLWRKDIGHVTSVVRRIIDQVILMNGSYYLPYQPFATVAQFRASYPEWLAFLCTKSLYDPHRKFDNGFAREYLCDE